MNSDYVKILVSACLFRFQIKRLFGLLPVALQPLSKVDSALELLHFRYRTGISRTRWRSAVATLWRPARAKPIALTSAAGCSFSDLAAKVAVIWIVHVQPSCCACLADVALEHDNAMMDGCIDLPEVRMASGSAPSQLDAATLIAQA
jgi:hypothetical protein